MDCPLTDKRLMIGGFPYKATGSGDSFLQQDTDGPLVTGMPGLRVIKHV